METENTTPPAETGTVETTPGPALYTLILSDSSTGKYVAVGVDPAHGLQGVLFGATGCYQEMTGNVL